MDLDIPWRIEATLPLLFLIVASVGYSLLLGGLTLILKRVGPRKARASQEAFGG